ncbi:MAG: DUF3341 domain-containing protein [Pirellulales bacterium]|nr:DUF3341 domain-containing protein [Pirellulales bacterium]
MDAVETETDTTRVAGILAEFETAETLKHASTGLREAGYKRFEAYSPFPVHGLYETMGRRRTILPLLVFGGGLAGCMIALLLQWWTNAIDYPYLISGKPFFSLPANIPITFELIILLGALSAFGGVMVLNNLPELFHPLFGCDKFRRATTDGFFIGVDIGDKKFDETETADLLRRLSATDVQIYHHPQTEQRIPGYIMAAAALIVALALLPPLGIALFRYAPKSQPRIHLVSDMDHQPKYLPQQFSPLFEDTRAMRPPVPGTVAVDAVIDDTHYLLGQVDGKPADTIPIAVTTETMRRGRERYDIFCATCHGLAGDGDGITSQLAFEREEPKWVKPLSYYNESVVSQPVGQIFQTISDGVRTMPGYKYQIPTEDRWAIVLYVRALQRSRSATIEDVPEELRKHLQSETAKNPNRAR